MARWFIIAGVVLIVIGVMLQFAPGIFKWFGKLPGDIRIVKDNFSLHIPIVSMLIISIILSVIIYLLRR